MNVLAKNPHILMYHGNIFYSVIRDFLDILNILGRLYYIRRSYFLVYIQTLSFRSFVNVFIFYFPLPLFATLNVTRN